MPPSNVPEKKVPPSGACGGFSSTSMCACVYVYLSTSSFVSRHHPYTYTHTHTTHSTECDPGFWEATANFTLTPGCNVAIANTSVSAFLEGCPGAPKLRG